MGLNEIMVRRLGSQRERLGDEGPRLTEFNALIRRKIGGIVDAIALVAAGIAPDEARESNNNILLGRGTHGGKTFTKPDTHMSGLGPGAVMDRPVVVAADVVFDGVTFSLTSHEGPATATVRVEDGATMIARGCVFEQRLDAAFAHVSVVSGGQAILLGCVFRGGAAGPQPVVRHGALAPALVQVAFCQNKTPRVLGSALAVTMTGNL